MHRRWLENAKDRKASLDVDYYIVDASLPKMHLWKQEETFQGFETS